MTIQLEAWSEQAVELTAKQAAAITETQLARVLFEAPPNRWRLVTDSRVGVIATDEFDLRVEPKLAIPQLMFLLSYATDPHGWREIGPTFSTEDDLFTAIASAFAVHAERALAPAPIRGYVRVEDQSTTLRGTLRMADQISRWPAQPIPLEIAYDDFTADIEENQLLRGAAELLLRMPLLPFRVRRRLLQIRSTLEDVAPARPSPAVEAPAITRLNDRYLSALALAELILRGSSISTHAGRTTGISFVFDMNTVFEDFLSVTHKNAIERHGGLLNFQFRDQHLDAEDKIRLIPDLTWWRNGSCRAVIDAKYKRLADKTFPNADAYQMLAYCTALQLDRGYLVYAKDAGETNRDHTINNAGKTIHVRAVDVERPAAEVLREVDDLAMAIVNAA
jgi:5-methylcytosine-specific restriction enzyme subunit McrC